MRAKNRTSNLSLKFNNLESFWEIYKNIPIQKSEFSNEGGFEDLETPL